ncbi:MAG TPA: hypothetical protein PKX20_02315 [Methanothrix soehngenii]|nr:hypothetical protein [Methanothrix soehngenii]
MKQAILCLMPFLLEDKHTLIDLISGPNDELESGELINQTRSMNQNMEQLKAELADLEIYNPLD